jgi:hypothetical protein
MGEGDLVVNLGGGGGASVTLMTGTKKVYSQAAQGSGNGNGSTRRELRREGDEISVGTSDWQAERAHHGRRARNPGEATLYFGEAFSENVGAHNWKKKSANLEHTNDLASLLEMP